MLRLHALVGIIVVGLLSLGYWQWSRYQYKSGVLHACYTSLKAPPVSWATFLKEGAPPFHRVHVSGVYADQKTLLLDNRWDQGRLGYEVLTPFRPVRINIAGANRAAYVLVDRGWVPAGRTRQQLPHIMTTQGVIQTLDAYVLMPPKKPAFMLGSNIESLVRWPVRLQQIHMPDIEKITGLAFFPYVLRLQVSESVEESAHVCDSLFTMMPARHLGYAVQWLFLSIAVLIAYLVFCRSQGAWSQRVR